MKKNISSIVVITIMITIAYLSFGKRPLGNNKFSSSPTTLDSLQGIWINEEDTLSRITINGRNWNSIYNSNNFQHNENARIYFSDIIIAEDDFRQASFDTTKLTGNYIVLVGEDFSLSCNLFHGFYQDVSNTSFTIQPVPTGTGRDLTYKKKN